jgi:hypothetical protein
MRTFGIIQLQAVWSWTWLLIVSPANRGSYVNSRVLTEAAPTLAVERLPDAALGIRRIQQAISLSLFCPYRILSALEQ